MKEYPLTVNVNFLRDHNVLFRHKYMYIYVTGNIRNQSIRELLKTALKSKLTNFWHISKDFFFRKHMKFVATLIFPIKID